MIHRYRSGIDHERGARINALASAGLQVVAIEGMLARCGDRPERIAERTRLVVALRARRAEEAEARRQLEWWEDVWT